MNKIMAYIVAVALFFTLFGCSPSQTASNEIAFSEFTTALSTLIKETGTYELSTPKLSEPLDIEPYNNEKNLIYSIDIMQSQK